MWAKNFPELQYDSSKEWVLGNTWTPRFANFSWLSMTRNGNCVLSRTFLQVWSKFKGCELSFQYFHLRNSFHQKPFHVYQLTSKTNTPVLRPSFEWFSYHSRAPLSLSPSLSLDNNMILKWRTGAGNHWKKRNHLRKMRTMVLEELLST